MALYRMHLCVEQDSGRYFEFPSLEKFSGTLLIQPSAFNRVSVVDPENGTRTPYTPPDSSEHALKVAVVASANAGRVRANRLGFNWVDRWKYDHVKKELHSLKKEYSIGQRDVAKLSDGEIVELPGRSSGPAPPLLSADLRRLFLCARFSQI